MTQWFQEFFSDPIFTSTSTNNSLWINTGLTIYMVAWTMALSIVIGIPLGIGLFELSRAHSRVARLAYQVLGFIVNVLR
ncbi:MAG: ABC transporter permease, partial [Dermabacter sp.]|nr:ABC transporter permease [Dermabacter sp.]